MLDRMAFSDEALAKAIVAFIQRRTCEQMSRARSFMYQLLSFLGSGTEDTGTMAYETLIRVATTGQSISSIISTC